MSDTMLGESKRIRLAMSEHVQDATLILDTYADEALPRNAREGFELCVRLIEAGQASLRRLALERQNARPENRTGV